MSLVLFLSKLRAFVASRYQWKTVQFSVLLLIGSLIKKYFESHTLRNHRIRKSRFQPKIVIIGAGLSGICIAYHLKYKLKYNNFIIYEAKNDVGGVWNVNKYPGCASDVDGYLYAFSFEPNYRISRAYPKRNETLAYAKYICTKYDIYSHIQFNTKVVGLKYNPMLRLWNVSTSQQKTVANIVISSIGQLSVKRIPMFKSMDKFKGRMFHSSEWDHTFKITEKSRIAVIGSAASAVQIVPEIANDPKPNIFVFQRSPSYVLPKYDPLISKQIQNAYAIIPLYMKFKRYYRYYLLEALYPTIFNKSWNRRLREKIIIPIEKRFAMKNALLAKKFIPPATQPLLSKRLLISSKYYPTLLQKNVQLITHPIVCFSENGIVIDRAKDYTQSLAVNEQKLENIELDCVIFATGFDTQNFLSTIKDGVIGKNGLHLQRDVWQYNNSFAYLGMMVNHFPNFFIIYGPGTNLGIGSVLFMIERSAEYIAQCISKMICEEWTEIDVKKEVVDDYKKMCDDKNSKSVWIGKNVRNWYTNKFGRVTTNWPFSMTYYWWLTRKPVYGNFNIVTMDEEVCWEKSKL